MTRLQAVPQLEQAAAIASGLLQVQTVACTHRVLRARALQ